MKYVFNADIQFILLKLYILVFFFYIPIEYNNYITIFYLILELILFLYSFKIHRKDFVRVILCLLVFLGTIALSVVAGRYSIVNSVQCLIFSLIGYSIISEKDKVTTRSLNSKMQIDWFYWGGMISIFSNLLIQYKKNGIQLSRFLLPTCWDTNYSYVVLLLFFSYCDLMKYKMWIPLAVLTVIATRDSRGSLLMVTVYLIIKLWKNFKKVKTIIKPKESVKSVFLIFVTMLISISLFSFYWVFIISSTNVLSYHEGINDNSNATRFRANVYVYTAISENPELWFYGYDNDIREVIGDTNSGEYIIYKGFRLVQSHNSIINMLMKNGVIFTIAYFVFLSFLLKKFVNINYLEYIIPYLLNSMIMHGMLTTHYLLFWLFILNKAYAIKEIKEASYLMGKK